MWASRSRRGWACRSTSSARGRWAIACAGRRAEGRRFLRAPRAPRSCASEFRSAALLLVPNVEDFGMVTVEALACGTPVVGLAGSGTADVVVSRRPRRARARRVRPRRWSRRASRSWPGAATARRCASGPRASPQARFRRRFRLPAGAARRRGQAGMIGEKIRFNRSGLVAVDLLRHLRGPVARVSTCASRSRSCPVTKGMPPFEPVPRAVPDHHAGVAGGLLLPGPAARAGRSAPGSRRSFAVDDRRGPGHRWCSTPASASTASSPTPGLPLGIFAVLDVVLVVAADASSSGA